MNRGHKQRTYSFYCSSENLDDLITLAYPDAYDPAYKSWRVEHLPIIPKEYKYVVVDNKGTSKQFEVIKSLMCRKDVDVIYA